jgi:predicted oxidoreductase (fatty acid repression mutant protein)
MSNFAKLQETRRTIYALGKELLVSNEEVVALVEKAMKESPSAFNSQSSRAVVLFGAESEAFWNEIAYSELEKVTPAEAFEGTKAKLGCFACRCRYYLVLRTKT